MHDARGNRLNPGDVVMVPAKIVEMAPREDHCNVRVETLYGRAPDGQREILDWINTRQLVRANVGDELCFERYPLPNSIGATTAAA